MLDLPIVIRSTAGAISTADHTALRSRASAGATIRGLQDRLPRLPDSGLAGTYVFFHDCSRFLVQAEECMAKTKTKKADSKQKKAAVKETTATLGWLEAAPIKKLIERGKKAGSLDTEEITEAYNATTHLMQVEVEELQVEDLMEHIQAAGIT